MRGGIRHFSCDAVLLPRRHRPDIRPGYRPPIASRNGGRQFAFFKTFTRLYIAGLAGGNIFYDAEKEERQRTICNKKAEKYESGQIINPQNTKRRNYSDTNPSKKKGPSLMYLSIKRPKGKPTLDSPKNYMGRKQGTMKQTWIIG